MLCVVIMSVTFFTIILADIMFSVVLLTLIMLSVILLNVIMLSVILLSVITLNVIMLNVVVPKNTKSCNSFVADDACQSTLLPGACTINLFTVVIHSIP
jgi:hypothetical protein